MTIPDDIMKAAAAIVNAMPHRMPSVSDVTDVIARAIAAERERCAKVADGYGWQGQRAVSQRLEAALDRADEIATAIRKGEQK